jgi:uncharacterized protein GlcG (DUF336 family)
MEAGAVATEAVATEAGTWPMRPTLPAALSRRLVDAAIVAATDLSMPVTVVIVGEETEPSSSQGRSGMNVRQLDPSTVPRHGGW